VTWDTGKHAELLGASAPPNMPRPDGAFAAHIKPTNIWWSRNDDIILAQKRILDKFDKYLRGLEDDFATNGFWTTDPSHLGTHRNAFIEALDKAFKGVNSTATAKTALQKIRTRILNNEFVTNT